MIVHLVSLLHNQQPRSSPEEVNLRVEHQDNVPAGLKELKSNNLRRKLIT